MVDCIGESLDLADIWFCVNGWVGD